MFGFSFSELLVIATVLIVVVGPKRLPSMLRNLGEWARKLRRIAFDMRAQSGLDDILRQEGLTGGIRELKELRDTLRGDLSSIRRQWETVQQQQQRVVEPEKPQVVIDASREYPPEGPDAHGALPEDLAHQSYDDDPEVEPHEAYYSREPEALAAPEPAPEPAPAPTPAPTDPRPAPTDPRPAPTPAPTDPRPAPTPAPTDPAPDPTPEVVCRPEPPALAPRPSAPPRPGPPPRPSRPAARLPQGPAAPLAARPPQVSAAPAVAPPSVTRAAPPSVPRTQPPPRPSRPAAKAAEPPTTSSTNIGQRTAAPSGPPDPPSAPEHNASGVDADGDPAQS